MCRNCPFQDFRHGSEEDYNPEGGGLGERLGDLFLRERGCRAVGPQSRGGEKGALGGKKWLNRALFICCGVSAPWREGKRGAAQPEANLFAVHKFWGVVESSKEDQCLFLRA